MRSGWNNQQKLNILLVTKSQRELFCAQKKKLMCVKMYMCEYVCVCIIDEGKELKYAVESTWILEVKQLIVEYNYTSVEAIQSWNEINKNVYESLTWTQPVYIDSQILMIEKYY